MEGALRIQDIIGLILAILIVAILISIILILRENARERRMWREEDYEDWREQKSKRDFSFLLENRREFLLFSRTESPKS